MALNEHATVKARIDRIRGLLGGGEYSEYFEAVALAQSVVYDTVGPGHPLLSALADAAMKTSDKKMIGVCKSLLLLYESGALTSPRLAIAHEIEGDILDIAQSQVVAAEKTADLPLKQTQLAIAAFLAGAALEDALRRLCTANGIAYDAGHTTLAKLQAALYQPSKGVEIISVSETKQITAWGDTRNKADHGNFADITHTEAVAIVMGTRTLIDKHLP